VDARGDDVRPRGRRVARGTVQKRVPRNAEVSPRFGFDHDLSRHACDILNRVTQVQSVSPRFAEGVYRDAIRSKMTSALHIYSSLSLLKEFHYTVKLFDCPWRSNPVMEILEKKVPLSFPYLGKRTGFFFLECPSFHVFLALDYFSDECFLVCWRRLRVLLDNRAAELALNYVSFLVSVVFSGPDRCRASLRSWIRDVVESNNSALILVEVLVILMLHQEKDRESVDGAVRFSLV